MEKEWISQGLGLLRQKMQDVLEQGKKRNWDKMSVYEKMESLRKELADTKMDGYFWVMDLYEDHFIINMEERTTKGYSTKLMRVPYTINNGVAAFGSPIEVERIVTYEPVTEATEQGEEQTQKELVSYQVLEQASPVPLLLNDDIIELQLNQEDLAQAKKTGDYSKGLRFTNAVLTTFNVKNSQNQVYPAKVWEKNLAQLQAKASRNMLLGEADHPRDGRPSVARNAIKIDKLRIQGNQVKGDGKILGTSLGKDLIAQAIEGSPIAVSSRGYGTVLAQEWQGEQVLVIQDDFVCVTFDAVWSPSSPGSYISGVEQSRTDKPITPEQTGAGNEAQQEDKGDNTKMNHFDKKVAELRGMIAYAKQLGQDVSEAEKALDAIVQEMAGNEAGMSESTVMAILGPVGVMLRPSGQFPPDNDRGGVNSMTRWAERGQADPAVPPKKKGEEDEEDDEEQGKKPKKQALSEAQQKAREAAVQELCANYDEPTRVIVQGLLEDYQTANEVLTKAPEALEQLHKVLGIGRQSTWGGDVNIHTAGIGVTEREARFEKAPKTVDQAISHLSAGLPDLKDHNERRIMTPDNQKLQFEKYVRNMAVACPHIMQAYIKAEQGRLNLIQSDLGVTADVAVSYAALLPMVRQAWAKLFLPVIASIQTLDRPEGKIFYQTALTDSEDDLNKYHYYDYADNDTEYADAKRVKFKITSETVNVTSKKLKTTLSYEEIQDARAYHNLDAFGEAIGIAAAELAREWNNKALFLLATASGTSGNVDFGMLRPLDSSNNPLYSQGEWETQGLKSYLNKVSGEIFKNRQNEMTHILVGPTAALQLEKLGSKFGLLPMQGDDANSVFAGVNIFGKINQTVTVYKVQIFDEAWALNKAVCIRRGETFSDTPFVFAPYVTDIEPPRHGIDGDFSVTQGIMSRAANKVVSPKNIATLTFKDEEGVPLGITA